jgi:hypothetical protein
MKKIFFALALLISLQGLKAQQIWSEDFQGYSGFGEVPGNGWITTGFGGFLVRLRGLNADTNVKVIEAILTQNRKKDSLITPSFGPLAANSILSFKARLVENYSGIIPTLNHWPAAGDFVSAYISTDGGTTYQLLQNLITSFPATGSSTAFVNFSIPLNGFDGLNARVKFVTKLTAGSYYPSFDDFSVTNLTSIKSLKINPELSLYPNPSNGTVLLSANGFSNRAQVEVFNILGTKVFSGNLINEKTNLDLSDLKSGVYLVKISEGKHVAVNRLILK